MRQEVKGVGGRGGEMNDANLFPHEVRKVHDFGLLKGVMDRLIRFESDLIFVNDDENMFERLDLFDKAWKLVAVEDRVVVLGREPSPRLNHPVDGRKARDDKDMIDAMFFGLFHGFNDSKHGSRFARLRQGHGQDTENGGIEKDIGDFRPELALIGKHNVKVYGRRVEKDKSILKGSETNPFEGSRRESLTNRVSFLNNGLFHSIKSKTQ
jgi:hypothetical protein